MYNPSEAKLYTATLKCAFCLEILHTVQHTHGPTVGLPLKLAGRADCPKHPLKGFVIEWSPEESDEQPLQRNRT